MAVTVTDFPKDGEVLYTLQLTHQGAAECVLDGCERAGVAGRERVDAELGMDPAASAEPVTLSPGGGATMTVGWGVEPAAARCTDAVSRIRAQFPDGGQAEARCRPPTEAGQPSSSLSTTNSRSPSWSVPTRRKPQRSRSRTEAVLPTNGSA